MSNGEPTPLRVAGVPEHFNVPWLLGLERGAFIRAGIAVKWRTVPEGTGAMCQLLRNGEVDIAMLVTEGAVCDILNGNPSRIITPYVDSPLTWGVHVGGHIGITAPGELKGLPFAISRHNSGSHLAAMAFARANGWTLKEEDLVVVNDLNGALARLQGPSPLAFLWEKHTTRPFVDDGRLRRVAEHRSAWPAFMLVATATILQEHPREVERLRKVIRDQVSGFMTKRTAPELIAQRYAMPLDAAQEWFADIRWNTGAPLEERALATVVESLSAAGLPNMPGQLQGLVEALVWHPAKA